MNFSNYLNKEIAGYELSKNGQNSISHIFIAKNEKNTDTKAYSPFYLQTVRPDLLNTTTIDTHFHTHLSQFQDSDRLTPSRADLDFKSTTHNTLPNIKF